MNSFGRLKIVKQVDDSETQSYVVFDPDRGREILLHVLPAGRSAENSLIWQRLERCLEPPPKIVLERGNLLGVQYIVTESSGKVESLIDLLERSSVAKTAEPGEFTRLFQSDLSKTAGLAEKLGEKPPAAPIVQTPDSLSEPGEFTRIFSSPPPPAEPVLAEPEPRKPEPPKKSVPRESVQRPDPPKLDRFMATPAPPLSPRASMGAKPSIRKPDEGDFARYFQDPLGKGSAKVDYGAKMPAPSKPPKKEPGNFTQMFGRPFSRDTKSKPAEGRGERAGATGVFSAGDWPSSGSARPGRESEFTRMTKSPSRSSPSEAPSVQSSAPTEADRPATSTSPILIYAVLGVLLALAIALVLYFVLKN